MRSAGLRNKPVDRRYLSDQDKSDHNNSGEYGKAARALSLARAYRGQQAYRNSRPTRTVERTPGTGGFSSGIGIQQARLREYGQNRKSKATDVAVNTPSLKGDLFKKDEK